MSFRLKRFLVYSTIFYCYTFSAFAQRPSSQILHDIQKLQYTSAVLYIAAHPDDENTRLLSWLANEKKVRTAYLSLTRGDGGQNLVGKEQGEALGLLRTQELLAARRTDGAEQFFTRANDFGYSKNPEETFRFWNKDSILYDVVFTIRKFRPDLIICRFPTTGEGGHGHHTASAILAVEAFSAAADPNVFPDQLKDVEVWKSKRILWNIFNPGSNTIAAENPLKTNCGGYNPLLGKSYGEIASESRSMHKSQGFGVLKQRGNHVEYFRFMKGDSAFTDIFENINTSWNRFSGTDKVQSAVSECLKTFSAEDPSLSIPALGKVLTALKELPESGNELFQWKKIKIQETEKIIAECSGLWIEALCAQSSVVPGETLTYSLQILNRSLAEVKIVGIRLASGRDSMLNQILKRDELLNIKNQQITSPDQPYSEPYWLSRAHTTGHYWQPGAELAGAAESRPALHVKLQLSVNGQLIEITKPLVYKSADPVKGEFYRNLEVLPAVTLQSSSKTLLFTDNKQRVYQVRVKAQADGQKGHIHLSVPSGWQVDMADSTFSIDKKSEEGVISFSVQPKENALDGKILFSAIVNGKILNKKITRVDYDHIPAQFFLEPAESKLMLLPLKTKNKNIAYVSGAGDDVADCLKQAGFNMTILNENALSAQQLRVYDAVITGVRAFNTNEKLYLQLPQFFKYVEGGGNLIVQYNTNSRIGPLQKGIGPYPFSISRDRVTDETSDVVFKNADHPVLQSPNKISAEDFKNWVQERGIYFAGDIDTRYQTILSMHDANEKPLDGSLIIAPYGKGNFVYTGLSFFRQLPAGVPGAYRLFTNLINLPAQKK